MPNSKIQDLKNSLGLGARSNKYRVKIEGPYNIGQLGDILCKSTTIPGRSFADIEVWNQGRLTVVAGDAQYGDTWSCTFMDTEDHKLRGKFIEWMEYIDSVIKDRRIAPDHSSYMKEIVLEQLSTKDNSVTASYIFFDIYPKSISDSSLSDESSEILEFTVEFNYSSWDKIS